MITFPDFKRLINPIKRKIFLSLARGILKAIDNSEGTQKIQLTALAGETITGAERFQEYGFETFPLAEAEIFGGFLNGNRDQGIILCIHDRRYRPKNLSEGEIALYTKEDATNDFRFWLKTGRIASLLADQSEEILDTSKTITAPTSTINSPTTIDLNGGTVTIDGSTIIITSTATTSIAGTSVTLDAASVSLGGTAGLEKLVKEAFKDFFNTHVHVDPQGGNTGVPTVLMDDTHMTTIAKAK